MNEYLENLAIILWVIVAVQVLICGFKITVTDTKKNTSKVIFEIKSLSDRLK